MVYSEPGQRESAKNIHLNVSVRAGVIGAVFWELQLAKCPTVPVERERERDDAASLKEEAGCWRRGCSGGAHGLCLLGEGLASKASVNLG